MLIIKDFYYGYTLHVSGNKFLFTDANKYPIQRKILSQDNKMPTGKQIRAARMLLGWDAVDLAKYSKLTKVTILNMETGKIRGRTETMERIVQAFLDNGIEFTENEGVRRRPSGVEIFEGAERFDEFYDFLYEHLKKNGGDVCLSVTDERLISKYRKDPIVHYKRMQDLFDKGVIKSFRILANKSNFNTQYNYNTYKWQPNPDLAPTAFYTFGDCLALISFVHTNPPYVVVMQSAPIAISYRGAFDIAWNAAKPAPSPQTEKKE